MTKVLSISNEGLEEVEGVNGVKALVRTADGIEEAVIESGSPDEWQPPSDWIDISNVGDNEINLLVSDRAGVALAFTVTCAGTFSIDWGDGNIIHNQTTGIKQKEYSVGGGQSCSEGYTTYKCKIYNATAPITIFKVARHNLQTRTQRSPILWAVIGTTAITDWANAFYSTTSNGFVCEVLRAIEIKGFHTSGNISCLNMFTSCRCLQSITLPSSWGNVSNYQSMFQNCSSLQSITLPSSWGSVSNCQSMFANCSALQSITLPSSWGSVSICSSMFASCSALQSITLPSSWGSVSNCTSMFQSCTALQSVTLPSSWGSVSNCSSMFQNCTALQSITLPSSWGNITNTSFMLFGCLTLKAIYNIQYLGSMTSQSYFEAFLQNAEVVQGVITIGSRLSAIGIHGASGFNNQITGLRLTGSGSTFTGSSPQVNVSYTSLDATALNTLFGDLPTLTSKTINITGCPGAATCNRSIATGKGWTVTG